MQESKQAHAESVMKEIRRIRKALDRLATKIEKEPTLMGSDYIIELALETQASASLVTSAVRKARRG